VLPGLVLALGFGVGGLASAIGMLRRRGHLRLVEVRTGHHWSWSLTIALGVGLLFWIFLEVLYLPERSFLEALYALVGVTLIALASTGSVGTYLKRTESPRSAR